MVEAIPKANQSKACANEAAKDRGASREEERGLELATRIALGRTKLEVMERITDPINKEIARLKDQLHSWVEELSALDEGQLLLPEVSRDR